MYVWLNVFIGPLPIIELLVTILNYSGPKRRKSAALNSATKNPGTKFTFVTFCDILTNIHICDTYILETTCFSLPLP